MEQPSETRRECASCSRGCGSAAARPGRRAQRRTARTSGSPRGGGRRWRRGRTRCTATGFARPRRGTTDADATWRGSSSASDATESCRDDDATRAFLDVKRADWTRSSSHSLRKKRVAAAAAARCASRLTAARTRVGTRTNTHPSSSDRTPALDDTRASAAASCAGRRPSVTPPRSRRRPGCTP
eukprot:31365-Pelagococcus_subviridis.AAC.30